LERGGKRGREREGRKREKRSRRVDDLGAFLFQGPTFYRKDCRALPVPFLTERQGRRKRKREKGSKATMISFRSNDRDSKTSSEPASSFERDEKLENTQT